MGDIRRMDDIEFKRKLSEVAEWRIPENQSEAEIIPRPNANYLNVDKRIPKAVTGKTYIKKERDDNDEELVIEDQNFPPLLLKIKRTCTCDDCGKICENGRTLDIRKHEHADKKIWRKRCTACEQWQDPYTGEFNQNGMENMQVWNKYLRGEAKVERLSQQEQTQKIIADKIQGRKVDIIESDEGVIIKYRD